MKTEEIVSRILGNDHLTYLKNKNRGGKVNEKGNTFENFFAVFKIAELLSGGRDEKCIYQIFLSSQGLMFVDDLIVEDCNEKITVHYQLKNALSLEWGEGMKSLEDDFYSQIALNKYLEKDTKCYLVVSNEVLINDLIKNISVRIKDKAGVIHFPYDKSLNIVIEKSEDFKACLEKLCPVPDRDKLEMVAISILGIWAASGKDNISIGDIFKKALDKYPNYIIPLHAKIELDLEVEQILSKIPHFEYTIKDGYLVWSYHDGIDDGVLQYSCVSERFKKFQELLKTSKPANFESLEPFLI